jgi:hypothetical protein
MIPIRIIHQIQTEIKDIVVILEVIIKDIIPVLDQEVIQNIDIPTTKKEDMMIFIIIDIIGIEDIIENIQIEKMVIEIEKKRKNT